MKRRQYIAALGTVGVGLVAGCIGGDDTDSGVGTTESPDTGAVSTDPAGTETETETPPGTDTPGGSEDAAEGPLAVLDSYLSAARRGDRDALAEVMHSSHPFNPRNLEDAESDSVSFEPGDVDEYERTLVDGAFDTENVREMPGIDSWFDEMDASLAAVLDGERAALAEVTYETTDDGETVERTEQLTLLTENGDWRVFLPYEGPADIPQGDPVDDDRYSVVDDVAFDAETGRAIVHVSDLGAIEAEEFVVYSASLGESSRAWSEESDTLPSLNYLVTPFDPEGDEIVVTVRFEDGEIVVHREPYPGDSSDGSEALDALDAYVAAAREGDLDALADAMHSSHPFNPDNLGDDARADFSVDAGYEQYESEIVDPGFGIDDIRAWEESEFWFDRMDVTPEELLAGEETVLAEITYEDSENDTTVERTEQVILLTDDGDWSVFLTYDRRTSVPGGDPVDDRYRVVDSVEFDTETERVTVTVSDVGDIEAEELVVYSSSHGEASRVWSEESDTLPAVRYLTAPFDPEGDVIVVTIRFADREVVVHRERYEPGADS